MLSILKGECYRAKYIKIFYICLGISIFFTISLCTNYVYEFIKVPMKEGENVVPSLSAFTQYFFKDYSLFYPMIFLLCHYFTDDFKNKQYLVLISKGIQKKSIFCGKLIMGWIITFIYLLINCLTAYVMMESLCSNILNTIQKDVIIYLILQFFSYIVYSSFIMSICILVRRKNISIIINLIIIIIFYLYLTRIGYALDLEVSLYSYWIIGFATGMEVENLLTVIRSIAVVLMEFGVSIYWSYFLFAHFDMERE